MIDPTPWAHRPHAGRRAAPIVLTPEERQRVEAACRPAKAERRVVLRAQALLLMAEDVPGADIAKVLGVEQSTVCRWRRRFSVPNPSEHLADRPRSGRPPSLSRTPSRSRRPSAPRWSRKPADPLQTWASP